MDILIIKTGALGDVVRCSFMAQALKDMYRAKNPKIYWITDIRAKPLFANNPYVDAIIESAKKEDLRKIRFDIVINLEEDTDNCRFASSLKPGKIIGAFLNKQGRIDYTKESEYWFNTSRISKLGEKKADQLKQDNEKTHRQIMSEIIGIQDWQKYEPFLRLNDEQRKISLNFMRRHNLSRNDLIIGINTGAADTWPKALSIKKTAELITRLSKEYGAKILLFGGPNELERNREIHKYSRAHILDTGCGNDLIEFPALVSVCSLFITSDSLGMHVALALKRKTVILIGPTSVTEIDSYGLGEKVVAKSKFVCTYRHAPKDIMDKLDIQEIYSKVNKLLKQKITFLITAFKEPNIGKAIESALNQKTKYPYDILVSAPDKETLDIAKKYAKKHKNIKIIKDPGKGKSFALNIIFKNLDSDILILSDGDVYVSENSVEEIVNIFNDPEIGCLTGRPMPIESRSNKYGYWANFLFEAAHKLRKNAFSTNGFIECSGYLFAFRKKMIKEIPLDVAEDSVIPYLFWEKGYRIGYAEKAEVYIKNVDNWKDWIKQKTRTSKAHETLEKYVDIQTTKRVKTFKNEAGKGFEMIFNYPNNLSEFWWTIALAFARFYMWMKVFWETKVKSRHYGDAWERAESTK
jgi:heptosyltransferase-2